jgi:site-specific DNA recombinase
MDRPGKKQLRCAIYTRKSTERNLDLEFNSLDAQREACEAYIKSQAHEGWRLIPNHYDDGAFSGASLNRPALQQLLDEIRAGKIDIVVVYKVDRLTRSLSDFAKLVELFDQHTVSFVSVTQSFNTTNSMGRLTLNVLLSFAQFEREVIGERVRDKIAASKAKGIWVGGSVPLGYKTVNKKLMVVPEEAETIRLIFRRYLELGSLRDLADDLDRKDIRTRKQKLTSGKHRGGVRFGVGYLAMLLRNRFYLGEVTHRGQIHPGEQQPILDRELFNAVQNNLAANANTRQLKLRASPSILAGRIFDEHGNRMTPVHTNKQGARYRYYVSHTALQGLGRVKSKTRINAADVETAILTALRKHLAEHDQEPPPVTDRELIAMHIERIVVKSQTVEINLADQSPLSIERPQNQAVATKGIVHTPEFRQPMSDRTRELLLTAIAKARYWIEDIVEGRAASFADIAKSEGKVERHIRLLTLLAFVSPKVIAAIREGTLPNVTVTGLAAATGFSWDLRRKNSDRL